MKIKRDRRNIGKAVKIVKPSTPHWDGTVGYITGFRGNDLDELTRELIPIVNVYIPRHKSVFPWSARSLKYVDLPRSI